MKRYAGVKEVAEYTSLSPNTIYEWSAHGRIPSIKYGRRALFDLQDIDKIMDSLKRTGSRVDTVANKILGDANANDI
jgi:excisionase family DNA binding protein